MLRNRSRAVTSKQSLMSDQTSFLSPTKKSSSPRFFLSKTVFDAETMSPTSILDSLNPFGYQRTVSNKPETEGIGLALIDDQNDCRFSKAINRMALFGSKLKVQIPEINCSESPADFGIKTRSPQLSSPFGSFRAKDLARQLSLKEMEMSEDYTCVITHGPNPKTTHIYDDCIVDESYCLDDAQTQESGIQPDVSRGETEIELEPSNFMSFCDACKAVLGHDKDIYIYRGEKAFCSEECRCEEMKKSPSRDFA